MLCSPTKSTPCNPLSLPLLPGTLTLIRPGLRVALCTRVVSVPDDRVHSRLGDPWLDSPPHDGLHAFSRRQSSTIDYGVGHEKNRNCTRDARTAEDRLWALKSRTSTNSIVLRTESCNWPRTHQNKDPPDPPPSPRVPPHPKRHPSLDGGPL